MNIKNPETQMLARELAKLTGESLTAAITEALRERLARVQENNDKASLAKRWEAIIRDSAPLWEEPWKSVDHGDLLYDERGLPK